MDLAAAVRAQVLRYCSGALPIADLWQWLQDGLWDIDNREDRVTAAMAHEVELLLSETAQGDWTEDELRDKLMTIASAYTFRVARASTVSTSSTVGTIIFRAPRELLLA